MLKVLFQTWTFVFTCGVMLSGSWGVGQDTRGTWQEALRYVDSTSPADIAVAIDKLKPIVAADRTVTIPGALTTLAICQLRQLDYDTAALTLDRLAKSSMSTQLQPRRGAMLRMSLIVALAREDAATADQSFKDLVRMVAAGQGDPIDLKQTANTIGIVVGMLSTEQAKSPIAARVLQIGSEQMLLSKVRGVATGYQGAFDAANERTAGLVANLKRIEKDGIEAVAAEFAQREQALQQRASELNEQKALTGEIIRNTREQIEQNTQDARKLAGEINRINLKLNQPTPGHPGPKRAPPPPLPLPSSIPVDEYEMRTEYDTVYQNGQSVQVPVTRQVRRPQYEISRDQDRIYRRMRDEHDRAMANYRTYEAEYKTLLTSWMDEDQRRRKQLNEDKAELEVKRNNLIAENKAINEDKKDSAKDLRSKRTETEQEEFEVELLGIAVQAYRDAQPQRAFRPQHFESLNWTQEKILLQKN